MNTRTPNQSNDISHNEPKPEKKLALRWWVRRFLWLVLALALLWISADFVHSRIVNRNLERWESSVTRNESGIRKGGEPRAFGHESSDIAILLIHGINETPHAFHKTAPQISSNGLYCYAMLLSGFGKSFVEYKESTIENWLDSVDKEVQTLRHKHKRIIVVGHSLGGAIAVQYVIQNPGVIDGLVLVAPAIDVSNTRSPFLAVRTWHSILNRTLIFSDTTQSPFGIDAVDRSERKSNMRMPFTPRKVIDQTFRLIDQNRDHEEELKIPVLMLLAKHDKVIDNDAARTFFKKLPNSQNRIVEFEKSAHAILVDFDWRNVADEICRFAKRHQ